MKIFLNGKATDVAATMTISQLLAEYNIQKGEVAIEYNREVVLKNDYERTSLHEGDRLEIVRFVGGG